MRGDRGEIVRLVALGRLSTADAERLLVAWNEGRETRWIVAGCVALAVIGQIQAHAGALLHIGQALALLHQFLGGVS